MRPYAEKLSEIISDIDVADGIDTPYHQVRKTENVLLVVIASNKGLCGAFNSNVIKEANKRIEYYLQSNDNISLSLMTIGKRSTDFFSKRSSFVTDIPLLLLVQPIYTF